MTSYSIIEPELRNTFPKIWEGFDLRGMPVKARFRGCRKCGVQCQENFGVAGSIIVNQCPMCLGDLEVFTVTQADVDAAGVMA